MSGKTTLMRTLGVAAILAHLGMGVPAQSMTISFLDSVITNMHVEDDLLKGESFFLAEVKSMKQTAESVAQKGSQLILMDELFKGTNVHDAYECTKAIVEGLLQHPNHLMILSTHLHEVARYFENNKGLNFYCFSTTLANDGSFKFNYLLEPGISDERIGYKILVQEGIVDILNTKNTA
jgi:DNA mismatch repair ATPase MutS